MRMVDTYPVLVVGLGHIGLPLALTLAKAGYQVQGVDTDPEAIQSILRGQPRIYEPGITALLAKFLGHNLSVTLPEFVEKIEVPRAIVVCVASNHAKTDRNPDLTSLQRSASWIQTVLRFGDLVIVRSTVPIGTTRSLIKPLLENETMKAGIDFGLAYCPERVLEGAVLREIEGIPQIIGGIDEESSANAEILFSKVTPHRLRVSSLEAAETVKLIDNVYRDTRFAFANTIAEMCEGLGLNSWEIIRAANYEYPRNSIPVPSPGVGGSCLPKDSRFLLYSAEGSNSELALVSSARKVNENTPVRLARRVKDAVPLEGTLVFVAGFAFKGVPETKDVRESPTTEFIKELLREGAVITGYDPAVDGATIAAMGVSPMESLDSGLRGCDICVFMTNHSQFQILGVEGLAQRLKVGALVVDGWNMFDQKECVRRGFSYIGNGNGVVIGKDQLEASIAADAASPTAFGR